MRKRSLLAATARVVAKLQHSDSTAVRAAASDFIAAAARSLSPAETYALLTPLVMPAMASEPVLMREPRSVSACLRQGGHSSPATAACLHSLKLCVWSCLNMKSQCMLPAKGVHLVQHVQLCSDAVRAVSNGLHEGPTRGTPRYGGRPPLSSRPSSSSTGRTGSLLQQLPSAPLYTVTIVRCRHLAARTTCPLRPHTCTVEMCDES